jgi:hypothetical protein
MELDDWKSFEMVLRYAHLAPEPFRLPPGESNGTGIS